MISYWESKSGTTFLDQDTSATEYINNFERYTLKLEKLGKNWTDRKKVRYFKKGFLDPD